MSQQTVRDSGARQQRGIGLNTGTLGGLHWATIGLMAISGAVHVFLFVDGGMPEFLLAGLGFYGGIAAILVTKGSFRHLLYLGLIPFTFAQIVAYYVVEQPQSFADVGALAIFDKIIQVTLIALLAYLFYTEWDGF